MLLRTEVRPVEELSLTDDAALIYAQGTQMVSVIGKDFGFDKVLATIDAYARGEPDGVKAACGITEDELVQRVLARLSR